MIKSPDTKLVDARSPTSSLIRREHRYHSMPACAPVVEHRHVGETVVL
jgi:hypothetical protein